MSYFLASNYCLFLLFYNFLLLPCDSFFIWKYLYKVSLEDDVSSKMILWREGFCKSQEKKRLSCLLLHPSADEKWKKTSSSSSKAAESSFAKKRETTYSHGGKNGRKIPFYLSFTFSFSALEQYSLWPSFFFPFSLVGITCLPTQGLNKASLLWCAKLFPLNCPPPRKEGPTQLSSLVAF